MPYTECMISLLFTLLAISLGINGALFLIAFALKSDKLTDASYAISFIALALAIYNHSAANPYVVIGVSLVCTWALRIGAFLLYRVVKTGKDSRFDGVREHFWKFGKFWLGQALTVWLLLIPLALASRHASDWSALSIVGFFICVGGIALEATADLQKYKFSHNPTNKDKWITDGVWNYSRHPNYFGEMSVWVGMYVLLVSSLSGGELALALISPLWIICLLLFVSGIPILEKYADKKWGSNASYQAYKRQTSVLIPLPHKK